MKKYLVTKGSFEGYTFVTKEDIKGKEKVLGYLIDESGKTYYQDGDGNGEFLCPVADLDPIK